MPRHDHQPALALPLVLRALRRCVGLGGLVPLLSAIFLGIFLSVWSAVALAEPAISMVTVRGGVHTAHDRIVIDWPRRVNPTINVRDNILEITVSGAWDFSPNALLAANLTRVGNFALPASRSATQTTLQMSLGAGNQLKHFFAGQALVLDVSGRGRASSAGQLSVVPPTLAPVSAATTSAAAPAATGETPPNAPAVAPAAAPPAPAVVEPVAAITPEAPANQTPANQPPSENTKEAQNAALQPLLDHALTLQPPPPPPSLASLAASSSAAPAAVAPVTPAPNVPPSTPPAPATNNTKAPALPTIASKALPNVIAAETLSDTPQDLFRLDPGVVTGLAVYVRGGYGYVIFDRTLTVNPNILLTGQTKVPTETLYLDGATGFRFALPPGVQLRVARDGTVWTIAVSKPQAGALVSLRLNPEPDFALGPRLVLPLPEPPTPIQLTDPVTGELMFVVPLARAGQQVSRMQQLVDVAMLPTAQGLLIRAAHEGVQVRPTTTGIEIVAKSGQLSLSPRRDTGAERVRADNLPRLSLLDLASWRGRSGEDYTSTRQRLMQEIIESDSAARAYARLYLARLYLAYGFATECRVMLEILARNVPDMMTQPEFLALRGAAAVYADQPAAGLADFDKLADVSAPELALWRAYAAAKQRDYAKAWLGYQSTSNVLLQMPSPIMDDMVILGLESALALNKPAEAYEWLEQFRREREDVALTPAVQYLRGVMEYQFGHGDRAENLWQTVALARDRLYRTRAELALIDLAVAREKMKPADAARRLEGLRFAWRGDDLELDILARLGKFYLDALDYVPGFNTLNTAIRLYPDHPRSGELRDVVTDTLRQIFLENLAPNLSPVEVLSLYRQYKNQLPDGEVGDQIGRSLAERLVSVDLLDEAAKLLAEQLPRLSGEQKSSVGARLATIYLLNREAEAAATALANSEGATNDTALTANRRVLMVRALADQGRLGEAEGLLGEATTPEAQALKIDLVWRDGRYGEAAKLLGARIGPPPQSGTPVESSTADLLVNRATALALAGDQAGLDRLAVDFGASIAGLPQASTFRLLTRANLDNLTDIQALTSKLGEVDLFKQFLSASRAPAAATGSPAPSANAP